MGLFISHLRGWERTPQIGVRHLRSITLISRSEKLQNEGSPNFQIFVPDFAPNFAPNFLRIFRGFLVLRFVRNGDQKKFTKNPLHFSMQNSQANTKYSETNSGEETKQKKKSKLLRRNRRESFFPEGARVHARGSYS